MERFYAIDRSMKIAVLTCTITPVVSLLFACGPSTIPRDVMPVYVDSVQRMIGARTFAHIRQKCLKRGDPSWINRYATRLVFPLNSRLHGYPRFVSYTWSETSMPMSRSRFIFFDQPLLKNAATAFCETPSKMATEYFFDRSTVALANEVGVSMMRTLRTGSANNSKTLEAFSG